jgi:hypothetical protein
MSIQGYCWGMGLVWVEPLAENESKWVYPTEMVAFGGF